MFRAFKPVPSDFRQFIELFYRTEFSFKLNQPSQVDNRPVTNVKFIPNFSLYCSMISSNIYCYRAFTDRFGRVIAGVSYSVSVSNRCLINSFVVSPSYQLHGFGREFYAQLEKYLKSLNVHQIVLISFSPGSMEFWEKMGFEEIESDAYIKLI